MTSAAFSGTANAIRAAIKQAHEHVLDGEPINITPTRDMIDRLSQDIGAAAGDLDTDTRDGLAGQLNALVNELDVLERLISERLTQENDQ